MTFLAAVTNLQRLPVSRQAALGVCFRAMAKLPAAVDAEIRQRTLAKVFSTGIQAVMRIARIWEMDLISSVQEEDE